MQYNMMYISITKMSNLMFEFLKFWRKNNTYTKTPKVIKEKKFTICYEDIELIAEHQGIFDHNFHIGQSFKWEDERISNEEDMSLLTNGLITFIIHEENRFDDNSLTITIGDKEDSVTVFKCKLSDKYSSRNTFSVVVPYEHGTWDNTIRDMLDKMKADLVVYKEWDRKRDAQIVADIKAKEEEKKRKLQEMNDKFLINKLEN